MTTPTPDRHGAERRQRRARVTPATVVRVPAKAVAAPARAIVETVRYWHAERVTLRQGMISLSISALGNLPTGLALGFMAERLELLPGLFILVPGAIGMRGAVFGSLGSRLGTSIHAGLFRVTRAKTGVLYQNVYAAVLLTFATSLFLAAAARAVSASIGLASISFWDFVAISVLGGVTSSALVLVVTVLLAREAARRGWDMDSVAAPLITFVGDIITLPALFAASFVAGHGGVTLAVGAVSAAACLWAIVQAVRTKLPTARRILRESAITLALAASINTAAGAVVEHRINRFLTLPALLIMLPSFLENAGALGGIVSSRLASRLHMGTIRPRIVPDRLAALEISLAGPWSILNFGLTGYAAHLVAVALGRPSPGALQMTAIALVAGAFATAGAAVVSYATAVATFRFDLDPDNHGIPMVTSTMDLIGVMCIVGAVVLLGVS